MNAWKIRRCGRLCLRNLLYKGKRLSLLESWVKGIAQAVAKEGKGEHDHRQHKRGKQNFPGMGSRQVSSFCYHEANTGAWLLYTQTKQADTGFPDNRTPNVER